IHGFVAPGDLRNPQIIPVFVPLRQHDEQALPHGPYDQGQERPPHADDREQEQRPIQTEHHPEGAPHARRPHALGSLPHPSQNRRLIPGNAPFAFPLLPHDHRVAPPTSPSSPMSVTPPPSSPALVKKPTLPARILLKGLSNKLPT